MSKKSESLKLIQQLRDEAHRFAITFHRQLRSKGQVGSALDEIKGIGEASKTILLKHFKSFEKIKMASDNELIEIIGVSKAKLIHNHIKKVSPN